MCVEERQLTTSFFEVFLNVNDIARDKGREEWMERKRGESSPREKRGEPSRVDIEERKRRKGNCANFKKERKKKREGLAVAKLQNIELTTIISPTISVFQDR